jgi:hexosaminidase
VEIEDEPAYAWRGVLLDVSRHFFGAPIVKHMLHTMALFKMNRFHWHLTDDQGWRVPIDKYPLLADKGAWRDGTQQGHRQGTSDGKRYGGAYTKQEIADIVNLGFL